MPLSNGTRLGPYEIVESIGAGGMGEVYRGRDTRLDRLVAIKVLPAHLTSDADLRQRLEREARAISSLNHPHICTLYDVGHQDGTDFLVMEYLDGETLADRLRRGRLSLEQVLNIGADIADALDKAHLQGIVHRDLKPGNIMLTKSGAKLMDFGLAKPQANAIAASASAIDVTASKPLTMKGTIVGTFQYMAPEQLEGGACDTRSDIFALGAVLYEMATGRRAFEGKSQVSVLAAILEKEPEPITSTEPLTPPLLEHVVRTCLAKGPQERWQSAHDVSRELQWIRQSGSQSAATAVIGRHWLRSYAPWLTSAALLIAAGFGWWLFFSGARTVVGPPVHFAVQIPPETPLDESVPGLAISPDGKYVASSVHTPTGKYQLYLYNVEDGSGRLTPAESVLRASFFSPDGQWLAFVGATKLQKMAVSGDQTLDICTLPEVGRAGFWGSDDYIYFALVGQGISRVLASGGIPEPVTKLETDEEGHDFPQLLPSGSELLFTARRTSGDQVVVQSLKTGKRRIVLENAAKGVYVSSGHLLFFRANALWAVPFDARKMVSTGPEFLLPYAVFAEQLRSWRNPEFAVSPAGTTLVYAPARSSRYSIVKVDRAGAVRALHLPTGDYWDPRFSPDGRFLVASQKQRTEQSLWLFDLARESAARLTQGNFSDMAPTWSPDGKMLVFTRGIVGGTTLMWMPADASAEPQKLYDFPKGFVAATSWSHDGKRLILMSYKIGGAGLQLQLLPMLVTLGSGSQPPGLRVAGDVVTLANASGSAWQAMLSPDGRWIAYTSDDSKQTEVYVRPAEPGGGRWQVSTDGGLQPCWSPDGKELYYRDHDKMMVVPISTQPAFSSSKPRVLFEGSFELGGGVNDYDLTPDGREFLMLRDESPRRGSTEYKVVLNWFEELKKLEAASAAPR